MLLPSRIEILSLSHFYPEQRWKKNHTLYLFCKNYVPTFFDIFLVKIHKILFPNRKPKASIIDCCWKWTAIFEHYANHWIHWHLSIVTSSNFSWPFSARCAPLCKGSYLLTSSAMPWWCHWLSAAQQSTPFYAIYTIHWAQWVIITINPDTSFIVLNCTLIKHTLQSLSVSIR